MQLQELHSIVSRKQHFFRLRRDGSSKSLACSTVPQLVLVAAAYLSLFSCSHSQIERQSSHYYTL